jgi:uncharacterized membrane protein YqjE
MKIMNQIFSLLALVLLLAVLPESVSAARSDDKTVVDTGSISEQFKFVVNKSTKYNDYRAVRASWLSKLRNNVSDTLTILKSNLKTSHATIAGQTAKIDSLTTTLSKTQANLEQVTLEKNSINFLGMLLAKNVYNSIVWLLIAGLIVLLVILFLAYKRSHVITIRTKHELLETKEEFEAHRKTAREREEKMARKHLDELLKYKYKSNQIGTNKNHS